MNSTPPQGQEDLSAFMERRRIWERKPQIRWVYQLWMAMLQPWRVPGETLEVGSGSGILKELLPEVHLSDVVGLPWVDHVVDATAMPFEPGAFSNIIGIDVLHHFADPWAFLREAGRVLPVGGRLLLIDVHVTACSWIFYRFLHHEDIYLRGYHRPRGTDQPKDPWQGNIAMTNVVFNRLKPGELERRAQLKVVHREMFSFFDFQLAGGFRPWALIPYPWFQRVVKLDRWLKPVMKWLGFRIFLVLEKTEVD